MVCRGVARDECIKNCEKLHQKPNELSGVETRFFKIMFGDEDYSKVLYLPPKFAKTVPHLADQRIQLEDACGLRWSITLSKVKGSLAFQKGWPKFFLDHGLEQGEFLVFEYIKGSHFVVRVFDKTACERLNFNNELPRQNKRARRDQDTASEGEPFQIADVNSGDKPASATSVASGSEFETYHDDVVVTNADVGMMQLPVSMNMEDPICMINRDDEHHQREDRNFLNDLSSFEMQNCTLDPNKSQKVLNTELDPCGQIGSTEQAKTLGDEVHSGDIFTDKLEKSLDAKLAPSHTDITERTKTTGDDDTEMVVIQTNQIKGHSGDIVAEKALETKTVPSHAEITKLAIEKEKEDDVRTAAIHSSQNAGPSGGTSMFFKKPSENVNLSKGLLDDVSNVQNESYSGSPSIGSSKIAEGLHVAKSRCHDSSVSSSVLKDPCVKHTIKKEQVEMEDQAYCFADEGCGKEPTIWNHDLMSSPAVKVEPDQSNDIGPLRNILPFSAEVKSKSYLELPPELKSDSSLCGKRDRGRGKIMYLKDSIGRIWPIFFQNKYNFVAFTTNWTSFCEANNIKPGDNCRFQVENVGRFQFRVDVISASNESPLK